MSSVTKAESNPTQEIAVLSLEPEDWHLWRNLRLQALAESPEAFGSTLKEWQGSGDTEARWRNRLVSVPLNLLATWQGKYVGMVGATEKTKDEVVELISLWVAPTARGRGISDMLVDAVIAWATEQNALFVALDVKKNNEHARRLYLRRGFVDVGESPLNMSERGAPERRFLYSLSRNERY